MNIFPARRVVIQSIFIVAALTLIARLFYIQIIDPHYYQSANNNVLRKLVIFPARGLILDRNGKILVQNEPVYDIMVIPNEIKFLDTLAFCKLLKIDKASFIKRLNKARRYSPYKASVFEKQLSAKFYASFQEKLFQYPGFFVQNRSIRTYPDSIAAQLLGYIGEVTENIIQQSQGYYRPGDYIGISGIEKSYEKVLRGRRGVQNLLVDALNRSHGSFAGGRYDTAAVAGDKLAASIDLRIQKLGEQLMKDKVGSIVAIEPQTGEVLAFVSSPTYDPNLMVGPERGNHAARMYQDPYKPFLIRPIQAYYSPASSFKPVNALIALQEGLIDSNSTIYCPGGYQAGNHFVRCEHIDGLTDLTKAIKISCNTYFCYTFEKLINRHGSRKTTASFNHWREFVNGFGLGNKLHIDIPGEKKGNVPTETFYNKAFGAKRWRSSAIISLAIGQGELLATPLQLANIECIIANRGYYYTPHLVKNIGGKEVTHSERTKKHYVGVDPQYFEPVISGMQQAVESGTAASAKIPHISMCGKTGTVQNSQGKNHSVFVAFAPREDPKIAIAVVVENAGYGASYAAPIASCLIEKYLTDSISKPKAVLNYILHKNLLPAGTP